MHRLQGIEASRRVGEVLLLSPQRGMFPLLAGDMNPSGEEVDVACQILHHETGGLSGGPLQLLLPIRVAGLKIVQQEVAVVADVVAATLLQRLLQVSFRFGQTVQRKQSPGCVVRRHVVPLGDLPGFLIAGQRLLKLSHVDIGLCQVIQSRSVAWIRGNIQLVGFQCLGQIELL